MSDLLYSYKCYCVFVDHMQLLLSSETLTKNADLSAKQKR